MLPSQSYARASQCGDVEEKEIEDSFIAAKRIDHFYDITDDLKRACNTMEDFKSWKKSQTRELRKNKTFKKAYKNGVSDVEDLIEDMANDLRIISTLLRVDSKGVSEHIKRGARILNAKRRLEKRRDALNNKIANIKKVMK